MFNFKNRIALVLVVVMVITIFGGCGGKGNEQGSDSSSTQVNTAGQDVPEAATGEGSDNPYAERIPLKMIVSNEPGYKAVPDTKIEKLVEEKFNVDITIVPLDLYDNEQWNLFWASGETADVIPGMYGRYTKMIEQDLIRDISPELVYELMPTWMKNLESLVERKDYEKKCYTNGKMYYVPFLNFMDSIANKLHVYSVRTDWMQNAGITKLPATIDEFHDLLVKFTSEDPDRNGKKDTTGINNEFRPIFDAYNISGENNYFFDNGKIVYTRATENYKAAIKLLSSWYKEGLIDPEFVSDNRNKRRQKWSEGKTGVLSDNCYWYDVTLPGNLPQMLSDAQPGAALDYLAPFEKVPEFKDIGGGFAVVDTSAYGLIFGKDTTDAQVERVLRMAEAGAEDFDWYVTLYYGIRGEDYEINKDGIYEALPDITPEIKNNRGFGYYFLPPCIGYDFYMKATGNLVQKPIEISKEAKFNTNAIIFKPEIMSKYTEKFTNVSDISGRFMIDVVTGKADVDSSWNKYIKDLNAAGLKDILLLTSDDVL